MPSLKIVRQTLLRGWVVRLFFNSALAHQTRELPLSLSAICRLCLCPLAIYKDLDSYCESSPPLVLLL